MPTSARPTPLRRLLKWSGILLPIVTLTVLVIVLLLVFTQPGWYRPASIDFNRLRSDKRELVTRIDEVGAALNRERSITVTIDQDQANRWLAARHELWPEATFELQNVEDPFVQFLDGTVRLAGTVNRSDWRSVLSLDLRIAVAPQTVSLELETARLGRFPVGGKAVLERMDLGDLDGAIRGPDGRSLQFDNAWIWPNGKRPYRITAVQVEPGRMTIALEPR